MTIIKVLTWYLVIINIYAYILMYYDKIKSKSGGWRVPENKLIIIAVFGGSLGILIAMRMFRHKTMHLKFKIGVPVILIVNIIIFLIAYTSFV